MAPKRASVPSNSFGSGPSALDKLTGRVHSDQPPAQDRETVEPQYGSTVSPQHGNTVSPQHGNTVSPHESADDSSTREKITFYLRPDQIDKLDELTLAYKRRTGQRLNRNELVRRMIDRCDLQLLLDQA